MASSQNLQGGALTNNDGSHAGNNVLYDCDGFKKTWTRCGYSKKCQHGIYAHLECEELEKCDEAEGDNSQIGQFLSQLLKDGEELAEWKKLKVLRQVLSELLKTDDGKLLSWLLMKTAYDRFPTAFPKEYCTGFPREVKIQMFQRTNRERFCSKDSPQVVKEFRDLGFRCWNFVPGELSWRIKGFIFSGETLGHLQSVAKNFEPTEEVKGTFKLPWRKTKGEEVYYLCKAAAVGDEKAHCVLNSSELNGRADSGEFIFQDHNLGDIVKDITKLGFDGAEDDDDHHEHDGT